MNSLNTKHYSLTTSSRGGAAALSLVLVISSIVLVVSVVGVIVSAVLVNSAFSERLSSEALLAARTGAQDAIIRIVRNKDCIAVGSPNCPSSYSITLATSRTADVTITTIASGFQVVSVGRAGGTRKVIKAELGVDPVTGEVSARSFKEDYEL